MGIIIKKINDRRDTKKDETENRQINSVFEK